MSRMDLSPSNILVSQIVKDVALYFVNLPPVRILMAFYDSFNEILLDQASCNWAKLDNTVVIKWINGLSSRF